MPSSSIPMIAPPSASPCRPVTLPVITAACACAAAGAAHMNATRIPTPLARLNVPRFMRCPLRCEPATRVWLRTSTSYTAASLAGAQSHRKRFLLAGHTSATLGLEHTTPSPMATTRSRSALLAALAVALPFLYLGPAAAGSAMAQGRDTLAADSSALVGQVAANGSHQPISGARVTIVDKGLAAITDSTGRFAITGLRAGVFVIEISAIGYAGGSWRVTLTPGHVLTHGFDLDPLPFELPEVVVRGKQPPFARRFADFERRRQTGMGAYLTQEQIERANPTNLMDILVSIRGVQQVCITNDCVAKMVRSPPG